LYAKRNKNNKSNSDDDDDDIGKRRNKKVFAFLARGSVKIANYLQQRR
jgi:hypothetical protein